MPVFLDIEGCLTDKGLIVTLPQLTDEFTKSKIYVLWLLNTTIDQNFSNRINIRHEDEMGRDLHLKNINELFEELPHSGSSIILQFYEVPDGPFKGRQYIYYDIME
jgi:tmRNA-binding protein